MTIDWTSPLEAVHTDGRIVPVALDLEYAAPDNSGNYTLLEEPSPESWYVFTSDGRSWIDEDHAWTIRNAPKAAPTSPPIPAPIAERMRGLIERMVPAPQSRVDIDAAYKEARAIMVELTPVDPDVLEGSRLAYEMIWSLDNDTSIDRVNELAATGDARGRELEREPVMSEQNEIDGANSYANGDAKTRNWFERQLAAWPERVDERKTTNISWLYGGVKAYRVEHGCDPELSEGMAHNVKFLDRHP